MVLPADLPAFVPPACGTPVVAARVGGLPDAVGDAAVLVDGHDPRDWAEALARLLADPAARAALGEAGRRRAATMSWRDTARAHLEAYRTARRQEAP